MLAWARMPPSHQGVQLVILGEGCAPDDLRDALHKHLQVRLRAGWKRLRSEGPRLHTALRQATVAVLFRGPQRNDREVSDGVRALLDEGLHSEGRLLQVELTPLELNPELDAQPLFRFRAAQPEERAEELLRAIAAQAAVLPVRLPFVDGPAIVDADLLRVDRKHQWDEIKAAAEKAQHLVLLVAGAQEEGHDYFQARVHYLWPRRRALVCSLVGPALEGFANREQFSKALCTALPGGQDAAGNLAEALHSQDVVLLWPVIRARDFHAGLLREALWEWLPALLDEAAAQGRVLIGYLRVVVNLEWSQTSLLAEMAARLGLSVRTLHRRLAEQGQQYQRIVDEVRRSLAIEFLENTSLSVEEIAGRVGFSEASNFRKAFRKWTGRPPTHFRAAGIG